MFAGDGGSVLINGKLCYYNLDYNNDENYFEKKNRTIDMQMKGFLLKLLL